MNATTSKPPQWDGKKGDSYLIWKIKFDADMVMKGLDKAFASEFGSKLPSKEKDQFDLDTEQGKKWENAVEKNKKVMMQFVLLFQTAAESNKLNKKRSKDWSRK